MKFVATKTADQLDLQALHRVRERLVGQRTGIINQIRAFLLEQGIAVRQGLRFLRAELPGILAMRTDVLSPRMSRVIEALALDWRHLDARIEGLSGEIETLAIKTSSPGSSAAPPTPGQRIPPPSDLGSVARLEPADRRMVDVVRQRDLAQWLARGYSASHVWSGAISGCDTARSIDDKRDRDDEHQRRIDGMQAKADGPPAVDRAMRQHVLQSNLNERNALEPLTIWFVLRGARVTVLLLR